MRKRWVGRPLVHAGRYHKCRFCGGGGRIHKVMVKAHIGKSMSARIFLCTECREKYLNSKMNKSRIVKGW